MEKVLLFLVCLLPAVVFAAPSITIQGRIVTPEGEALEESAVKIRIKILTPNSNECILYDESHTIDMTHSAGLFSVNVGDGLGTRNDSNAWSFISSMSNINSFSVNGANCSSGTGAITYAPSANDERKVSIFFQRSSMTSWEEMTDVAARPLMSHSPFSLESRKVGGFAVGQLCRVADAGVPQNIAPLTSSDYGQFLDLLAGTSLKYMTRSTSGGASLPSYNGAPATTSAGDIWFDTATNQVMYNNGTVTPQPVGGTFGSQSAKSFFASPTGASGVPTFRTIAETDLPSGVITTPGTYKSVTVDTYGRVTAGSNPTALGDYGITDAVKVGGQAGAFNLGTSDAASVGLMTGGTAKLTVLSSGKVGIGTTTPSEFLTLNTTGSTAATISQYSATGNSTIYQRSTGGTAGITSISIGSTSYISHQIAGASWSSVANNALASAISADAFDGTSFLPVSKIQGEVDATPSTGNIKGRLTFHTSGGSALSEKVRITNDGRVGIGTTDPQAKLDIAGYMRMTVNSSAPASCTVAINGSIALASNYTLCICKGSTTAWVKAADGTTACAW